MADIFISYSKRDADQARLIAAFFEAQGYSVWYDVSLVAGDQFRKTIMKELAAAKAVIVLWTENSVNSDWVQAEAAAAHSDRKLVPLKALLLSYDQIPPPFNNLHTTNYDNHEAVLTAVKMQLAKAPTPPPMWKKARYEALTWFGIIGGALTLANALSAFRDLAKWIHFILDNWKELLYNLWSTLFSYIGLSISKDMALCFSSICFLFGISIGSIFSEKRFNKNILRFGLLFLSPGILLLVMNIIYWIIGQKSLTVIYMLSIAPSIMIFCLLIGDGTKIKRFEVGILYIILIYISYGFIENISNLSETINMLLYNSKMFSIYGSDNDPAGLLFSVYTCFAVILAIPLAPVVICPADGLIKRLSFLLIGVILIFGLSEASKLVEHFNTIATQVK